MARVERGTFWESPLGVGSSSVPVAVSFPSEHSRTGGGTVCRRASKGGAQNGGYTAGPESRSSDWTAEELVVAGVAVGNDAHIS
jgi:hypothetical protein